MNAVVSGTSRGIGRAVAERFLRAGDRVFGLDIDAGTVEHPNYSHYICDVRSGAFPDLPEVGIVISNAGTLEEKDAIEVNLLGAMRFAEHYVKSASLRSVLFIASASARSGAEFPRYVASKAGLVGYMKNTALALAGRGVTCNSISPGGVITEANRHILDSESLYEAVKAETLLGKWAEPEEIAELAYFLTAVNRSVTGEDILIDNGEMLKSNFIW
ncbi:MAG: SDR family oxidoreductase [Oscillospiraceae bacterium]|nr:SDR family oxidoreductase [Oscillospiraceae bacterium]